MSMGDHDEVRKDAVGGSDSPFLSGPHGTAQRTYIGGFDTPDGISHLLPKQEEETDQEISMIVFRDGCVWEASVDMHIPFDGSPVWWATAIAALDTSVDIALADE
jgi:hypothetical protein